MSCWSFIPFVYGKNGDGYYCFAQTMKVPSLLSIVTNYTLVVNYHYHTSRCEPYWGWVLSWFTKTLFDQWLIYIYIYILYIHIYIHTLKFIYTYIYYIYIYIYICHLPRGVPSSAWLSGRWASARTCWSIPSSCFHASRCPKHRWNDVGKPIICRSYLERETMGESHIYVSLPSGVFKKN